MRYRRSEAGAVILRGHTDVVHDLRFIPESEILLSVSSDKDMRAWRLGDYSCAAIYRYASSYHFNRSRKFSFH